METLIRLLTSRSDCFLDWKPWSGSSLSGVTVSPIGNPGQAPYRFNFNVALPVLPAGRNLQWYEKSIRLHQQWHHVVRDACLQFDDLDRDDFSDRDILIMRRRLQKNMDRFLEEQSGLKCPVQVCVHVFVCVRACV